MYPAIAKECQLPPDAAEQLSTEGFIVLRGPSVPGGIKQLQAAYDASIATADAADVRVASSVRVTDFVNRSAEFDSIYIYPPLLAACCLIIGRPFKLSGTCARTLNPGTRAQQLHVDVEYGADDWPLVGYIWMIDEFNAENGATQFVPGSHRRRCGPNKDAASSDTVTLACGPAGSLIVFDASVWHGHTANCSAHPRRSVQGHFVARDARSAIDYRARIRPETLTRVGELARYLLDVE